jgi:hypothetical protein
MVLSLRFIFSTLFPRVGGACRKALRQSVGVAALPHAGRYQKYIFPHFIFSFNISSVIPDDIDKVIVQVYLSLLLVDGAQLFAPAASQTAEDLPRLTLLTQPLNIPRLSLRTPGVPKRLHKLCVAHQPSLLLVPRLFALIIMP